MGYKCNFYTNYDPRIYFIYTFCVWGLCTFLTVQMSIHQNLMVHEHNFTNLYICLQKFTMADISWHRYTPLFFIKKFYSFILASYTHIHNIYTPQMFTFGGIKRQYTFWTTKRVLIMKIEYHNKQSSKIVYHDSILSWYTCIYII